MKTILISLGLIALTACGLRRHIEGDGTGQTVEVNSEMKKPKPAVLGYSKQLVDSLQNTTIDSAYIEGNNLIMKVHYSGGCQKHTFSLEGNTAISKSLPAIRSVRLIHNGKKDNCKAMIMDNLSFDLSELAYKKEDGSQIKLSIEGYKEQLMYTYTAPKK